MRDELIGALRSLTDVVGKMRVPQTVADAALQLMVVGPSLEAARAALAALDAQQPQERNWWWAAISTDGEIVHAYKANGDGGDGEYARTEMNDWINENSPTCSLRPIYQDAAPPSQPQEEGPVIDVDLLHWESIKEAASKSPWIPPEYWSNDWVVDVIAFLTEPPSQQAGDWKAAYEGEARKFQQETLRTSELSALLTRFVEHIHPEHTPGPWSRGCIRCALIGEAMALLQKQVNAPAPTHTAPEGKS